MRTVTVGDRIEAGECLVQRCFRQPRTSSWERVPINLWSKTPVNHSSTALYIFPESSPKYIELASSLWKASWWILCLCYTLQRDLSHGMSVSLGHQVEIHICSRFKLFLTPHLSSDPFCLSDRSKVCYWGSFQMAFNSSSCTSIP